MNLLCNIFGHKWKQFNRDNDVFTYRKCERCGSVHAFVIQHWADTSRHEVQDFIDAFHKWQDSFNDWKTSMKALVGDTQ